MIIRKEGVMENIIERLIKFHEEEGVPYAFLSQKLQMNASSLRAVIGGRMKLKQEQKEKIDNYLSARGY